MKDEWMIGVAKKKSFFEWCMLSADDRDVGGWCGSSEKGHEVSYGSKKNRGGVPEDVRLEMGVEAKQKLDHRRQSEGAS